MLLSPGFKDIVDIILVALLMYQMFNLLKKSGAINVFIGILSFIIAWFMVSYVFKMELLGAIFDRVVSVGAFGLIVLFQNEIRRFFSKIGSKRNWGLLQNLKRLMNISKDKNENKNIYVVQIVLACRNMAKTKTGALIVVTKDDDLELYAQSGEIINSNINSRLIENIFFKNSPLHDGALIISKDRIKAAGCILPVSKNQTIPKRYGLRHRAALGVSELSDAVVITVSEETGQISWAINGMLNGDAKPEELEHFLSEQLAEY
ncbi:MAG: diadenylate cyclase CdaA [Prevotellaceae bacterium]|jgi:uncharacterized protein (TIGR00159 family)|nr:diadenylate cyclase CdaA [Prevotellaceae bacterium]